MSIVVRYPVTNLTKQQYDSVHGALQAAGSWPPDGCLVHVCFGDEPNLHVSEIWESREQMDAFGETIQPHLEAASIQFSGEPEVFEAVNLEKF